MSPEKKERRKTGRAGKGAKKEEVLPEHVEIYNLRKQQFGALRRQGLSENQAAKIMQKKFLRKLRDNQ
jgi:hypothetical protein